MPTMTWTIDAARIAPSASLRVAARSAPLLILTGRALGELVAELGGYEAAGRYLITVATNVGRPIGVNFPTGPDSSCSIFVPPKGWGEERLAGWVAGRHREIETTLGPATPLRWEDV